MGYRGAVYRHERMVAHQVVSTLVGLALPQVFMHGFIGNLKIALCWYLRVSVISTATALYWLTAIENTQSYLLDDNKLCGSLNLQSLPITTNSDCTHICERSNACRSRVFSLRLPKLRFVCMIARSIVQSCVVYVVAGVLLSWGKVICITTLAPCNGTY